MIRIKDLGFSYGDYVVLKNITMNLEEGHIYGLLGENGVGKTTLLTLLCGLKKVKEGSIETDGENPFDRRPSFLSDQYYLSDEVAPMNMKAVEYARNYGKFWDGFNMEEFIEIMKELDTDPEQKMTRMSFGQLKKTYISFALACRTKYLFMDEPTNGLDITSKAALRSILAQYADENKTILISTHQAHDIENLVDRVVILHQGDVLLNQSVSELQQLFGFGITTGREAIYSQQSVAGTVGIWAADNTEEGRFDLELLFNAAVKATESVRRVIAQK